MPFPAFLKCCAWTEENKRSKHLVLSSNERTEIADILPRTILPPKREAVKLPEPQEAHKINQEMLRAMDNYRDKMNSQHIHRFLRISHRKLRGAASPVTSNLGLTVSQLKPKPKPSEE